MNLGPSRTGRSAMLLLSAEGISEVASVGGFVKEYQIDVDPDAMRAYDVGLDEIFMAVKMSNIDVGARTIEILTMLVVPVLYCWIKEVKIQKRQLIE